MDMTIEEFIAHIPIQLTPDMERFAADTVFKSRRYIFTSWQGKQQHGYCCHCRHSFPITPTVRHLAQLTCPNCGSDCKARAEGRGRKGLIDEGYFTYYLKSALDPDAVTAIGMYVVRDYSGDYRTVETQYAPRDLYLFRVGKPGVMVQRYVWYRTFENPHGMILYAPRFRARVRCQFRVDHIAGVPTFHCRNSLAAAVANTPYQYSTWEEYNHGDMTEFLDLYSVYPSIEYLTKLGFSNLVVGKLDEDATLGAVNWRGRTPLSVLKLTRPELSEIRQKNLQVNFSALKLIQLARREGSRFTPTEVVALEEKLYASHLIEMTKHTKLKRAVKYLEKQCRGPHPYRTIQGAQYAWHDYIEDCKKLQLDLLSERVLFPRDLYMAHQETIELRRARADALMARVREAEHAKRLIQDAEYDRRIQASLRSLAGYQFSHGGLTIRPIIGIEELQREGQVLHHCVYSYAPQYANGKTLILALRRDYAPDEPFYTVEVFKGRVTQCYGLRNCRATDEVQAFMDAFSAAKLDTKHEQEVAN